MSAPSGTLSARAPGMTNQRIPIQQRRARSGFSMVELALTLTVIAILAAMMIPKFSRVMEATRISRQTAMIAADMEQAFTLAARYRRPMRVSCTCGTGTYTIADRTGGTVRLSRTLGQDGDLGNVTLTFTTNPAGGIVDVFPSGVSSGTLTARITSGGSTRAVMFTTAGHVRIIP
jgi:prepilin-type N-terminal cleavage/methylation domain-containing protein